jgi:hypothetical protein
MRPDRVPLAGRHLGAIAQLEERLVCIQKARGSSPLSSTGQRPNAILKASKQSQSRRTIRCAIRHITATARRGHGEGSVYRDAVSGTWVGAISLGWRPDGSPIRRKVTGRTKTEIRQRQTTADHHGGRAMRVRGNKPGRTAPDRGRSGRPGERTRLNADRPSAFPGPDICPVGADRASALSCR